MLEIGIYGENGRAEVGRLILASTEALLLYHAASRDAALAQGRMIPNQLASIGRGDEDPGARLAIALATAGSAFSIAPPACASQPPPSWPGKNSSYVPPR